MQSWAGWSVRQLCAAGLVLAVLLDGGRGTARAIPVDELAPDRDWTVNRVKIRGNEVLSRRQIRNVMVTRPRSWYALWRRRPPFDPIAFGTDLDRVTSLYRRNGYYHARVEHDIDVPRDGAAIGIVVRLEEGPPIEVARVDVALDDEVFAGSERVALLDGVPLVVEHTFTESAYNGTAAYLRAAYRDRSYAQVKVTKRAAVDVRTNMANVEYVVKSGAPCVFGEIRVEGNEKVSESVIRREVTFVPGEPFNGSLLRETRDNLQGLALFRTVKVVEEYPDDGRVDIVLRVREQPARELRVGVGFDSEAGPRGSAGWRSFNFLGGARQLGATARASILEQSVAADFIQPHFPFSTSRSSVVFGLGREEEETFTLDRTRVSTRVDWSLTRNLGTFLFYRFENDTLLEVKSAIEATFPGIAPADSDLSGFGLGLAWNKTDNLRNPTRGWASSIGLEPVGGPFGGDVSFVRMTLDVRGYYPLIGRLVGASQLRIGTAEPISSSREIPLFERFYAGGLNSVRGYGRRRIGPRVGGDPVGGRSGVTWTLELRHPIRGDFAGVVFLDAGQVALDSYDFPFDDLRYGSGFGVRYNSPVGPISLDLGFGAQPPGDDQIWQIYVSLGSIF